MWQPVDIIAAIYIGGLLLIVFGSLTAVLVLGIIKGKK
jgi:hypothetical protein